TLSRGLLRRFQNLARPIHHRYIGAPVARFAARIGGPYLRNYRAQIFRLVSLRAAVDGYLLAEALQCGNMHHLAGGHCAPVERDAKLPARHRDGVVTDRSPRELFHPVHPLSRLMLPGGASLRTRSPPGPGFCGKLRKIMQQAPEHPVQRNIVQRFRGRRGAALKGDISAPDIGVSPGKPDLLGYACVSLEPRFSPDRGLKRLPVFIDRQGVKIDPRDGRQVYVVELVPVAVIEPETAQRDTQRANRVEQALAGDAKPPGVMNVRRKARPDTRKAVVGGRPVKLPRRSFQLFGAVAAFKEPYCANETHQRAGRIGAPREAEYKHLIAGLVVE